MGKLFLTVVAFFVVCLFFSFKLTQVPDGLTVDESSFGYNAILLSNTLRDQNGRFLPIFVLSIDGKDWRQPVTQYFLTAYFKLFGASLFNLKFTSVIIVSLSAILIFFLGKLLQGTGGGVSTALIFLLTPILMIHAHLGLDNIYPIPFTIIWLMGVYQFKKTNNLKYLILAGISLGIGYYTYKGMRSAVPVWSVLTTVYIVIDYLKSFDKNELKKVQKPLLAFFLSVLPFFAIIPLLEYKYAGAVLGLEPKTIQSVYSFFYPYFSSFDPSFLFIKGDDLPQHSTGRHGMFLLASLPLFLVGLYQAIRLKNFWTFLAVSFFSAPLLYGFVDSVHRASRLLYLLPAYSTIGSLGLMWLLQLKGKLAKCVLILTLILMTINYFDFVTYYWFQYAPDTRHIFYRFTKEDAYKKFASLSQTQKLTPYIDQDLIADDTQLFLKSLYLPKPSPKWISGADLPQSSVLLTPKNVNNLKEVVISEGLHIYTK